MPKNQALIDAANEAKKLQEPIQITKTAQHTPGPWSVCVGPKRTEILDADNMPVVHVYEKGTVYGAKYSQPVEANAHLIKAAPNLLAALESLFENCAMIHKHWGEDSNQKEAVIAIANARAAIAEAKGEL